MTGTLAGRTLNNRYNITERIGIGGMAEVYMGQDAVLGRSIAIKVMLPQYAEDPAFTARFRQEAAAAANLSSPYIVNVYDWGNDNGTYYIVMEFVRGSDLKTAIRERGAINQRKVAEIGSQVCQALSVAHNQDIIHRDIKPQNIMVQPDGNVKVMDFGIARAKNSLKEKTSAVLGTAHYISPEQAQGKDLTAASDIYSLGIVLYEAATGQLPFDGPDAVSVAMKQVNEQPVAPHEVNPNIDANLEAIILKAMCKNPNERFSTAREMRQALNDYLAGRPVSVAGFTNAQTAVMGKQAGPTVPVVKNDGIAVMPVTPVTPGDNRSNGQNTGRAYIDKNDAGNKNKKKRKIALIVGIVAAVVVIAALALFFAGQNEGVEVPDVSNLTLKEATAQLKEAGFDVGEVTEEYSDTVEKDKVISQDPKAGARQKKDTKIDLVISLGQEMVQVPNLSNLTAAEAKSALEKAGLKFESGAAEHSDTVEIDHVVRQDPAAGEEVAKGSTVTYYLSAGKEEKTVVVPSVIGKLEGDAESTLMRTSKSFNIMKDYVSSTDVPSGQVMSQDPAAGVEVDEDATIYIQISSGGNYVGLNFDSSMGSVSSDASTVADGGSATITVTPNDGYAVSSVYDSNGVSYNVGATGGSTTIGNILGDVYVTVEFAPLEEPEEDEDEESAADGTADADGATKAAG